jgi:hypothetical protein
MFQVLLCLCGCKTCVWQVKLCDHIKYGALSERLCRLWAKSALYKYTDIYITILRAKIEVFPVLDASILDFLLLVETYNITGGYIGYIGEPRKHFLAF